MEGRTGGRYTACEGSGGGGGAGGAESVDGCDDFIKLGLNLLNLLDLLFKETLVSAGTYCFAAFFLLNPIFLDEESSLGLAVFLLGCGNCLVGGVACPVSADWLPETASLVRVVLTLFDLGLGVVLPGTVLVVAGECFLSVGDFLMRSSTFFGGKGLTLLSLLRNEFIL